MTRAAIAESAYPGRMARDDLRPPLDPDLRLDDLEAADGDVLLARADLAGLRVSGVDLADRDLTGIQLSEVSLAEVRAEGAVLRAAVLSEVTIERLDAPVLDAARSRWRTVVVSDSRVGSLAAFEADLDVVRFERCRIGFADLRGATLTDVAIVDCTIDELDLGGATVTRLAVPGSSIRALSVRESTLAHVDLSGAELDDVDDVASLRGAAVSSDQLFALRGRVAAALGLRLID